MDKKEEEKVIKRINELYHTSKERDCVVPSSKTSVQDLDNNLKILLSLIKMVKK